MIILALLVGLFLFMSSSSEPTASGDLKTKQRGEVTDRDMAQVIKMMLERVIGQVHNREFDPVIKDNKIILSTKNIKEQWAPEAIAGVSIQLMDPEEIQKKANCKCDFLYLEFSEIKIANSRILISLGDSCARSENCDSIFTFGGGQTWEYQKKRGKWVGKFITGAIS